VSKTVFKTAVCELVLYLSLRVKIRVSMS